MEVENFENNRWASSDQKPVYRHHAALRLIKEGTVLDVGCGDGLFLAMLKEKGLQAEGIDLSEEAVKKCTQKGLQASVQSFETTLPYEDDSFEYVVLLDVLEHLYSPTILLEEARRVSRKYVVVSIPNFSSLPARVQILKGGVPENNRPQKGHVYWFTYRVFLDMCTHARLTPVEWRNNTFKPFASFSNFFLNLRPHLFALSFVVLLRK